MAEQPQKSNNNDINAFRTIVFGIIIFFGIIFLAYFFWSSVSWEIRLIFVRDALSIALFISVLFALVISIITHALGRIESPFISAILNFFIQLIGLISAKFESKKLNIMAESNRLEKTEKLKQDVLDFMKILREEINLMKSEIPGIIETKYNDYVTIFENEAKEIVERYSNNEKSTKEAKDGKYKANRELMRQLLIEWLGDEINNIETEENLSDLWNPESILTFVEERSDSLIDQGFNLAAIEQFCKKQNKWIFEYIQRIKNV